MVNYSLIGVALTALMVSGCTRSDGTSPEAAKTVTGASQAATPTPSAIPQDAVVLNFRVTGMHCDGCANALKGKLVKLDGVLGCDASFAGSSATVTANDPAVAENVLAAVTELGYTGELVNNEGASTDGADSTD